MKPGKYSKGNKNYVVSSATGRVKQTTIEFKKISRDRAFGKWADDTQSKTKVPKIDKKTGWLNNLTTILKNSKNKETILINVGIGRGKTTSIYKHVKYLYNNTNEVVIMASPFKVLVQKDYDGLVKESIPPGDIQNYLEIQGLRKHYNSLSPSASKKEIEKKHINKKRIHIISFSSLIHNPADVSYFSSKSMKQYVQGILDHLKSKEKKVTLIMDEIHESVRNFSPEYIFNLYRFKPYIKKVVIASATFTESSIEASIRISHLTDYYTQVIELSRQKFSQNNLGTLNLCFTNSDYRPSHTKPLDIIKWVIKKTSAEKFHVLCYSIKLAKELALDAFFKNLNPNICDGDTGNKFDENRINIGTNFKTGVDIPTNDPFFIILPVTKKGTIDLGIFGIFSDGVPSIIQAIGRVRKKGNIYAIFPAVKTIIRDRDSKHLLTSVKIPTKELKYLLKSKIDSEFQELIEHYLKKYEALLPIIKEYEDYQKLQPKRSSFTGIPDKHLIEQIKQLQSFPHYGKAFTSIPSFTDFILSKGQEILVNETASAGKDILPYVIWAAVHDQFTNCKLSSVITVNRIIKKLYLTSAKYASQIVKFINSETDNSTFQLAKKNLSEIFSELLPIFKKIEHNGLPYPVWVYLDRQYLDNLQKQNISEILVNTALTIKNIPTLGLKFKEEYLAQKLHGSHRNKSQLDKEWGNIKSIVDIVVNKYINCNLPRTSNKYASNPVLSQTELRTIDKAIKYIKQNDQVLKTTGFNSFFKTADLVKDGPDKLYNNFLSQFVLFSSTNKRLQDAKYKTYKALSDFI